MNTETKAAKLISALLGEEGPDDYLKNLGIVRQSKTSNPPPSPDKPIDIKPDSLTGKLLSGTALDYGSDDMDADDLLEKWADKRLPRGLRADRDTVEALLDDLGSSIDEYIEYNEEIYNKIIEQVSEALEQSKGDPNGWFERLKASLSDEEDNEA
jgi:hypothetical protein